MRIGILEKKVKQLTRVFWISPIRNDCAKRLAGKQEAGETNREGDGFLTFHQEGS